MAKRNARAEITKKQKTIAKVKEADKAKRQEGIQKQLKNKKAKTKYYSHSKGI